MANQNNLPGEDYESYQEDYGNECIIQLFNGYSIRTDSSADNPDGSSYVRVCDQNGEEIAYWSCDEWAEDPQLVMGAILGAAKSGDNRL